MQGCGAARREAGRAAGGQVIESAPGRVPVKGATEARASKRPFAKEGREASAIE